MKNGIALLFSVGIVFGHFGCSNTVHLEKAINAILAEEDPADWNAILVGNRKHLERFRHKFGLPDVSHYSSNDYDTVLGLLAFRFSEWGEWDSAVEFAEAALSVRKDPLAIKALIKTAMESNNPIAKKAVLTMNVSDTSSLARIDLLIAKNNYTEALEELEIIENKDEDGQSIKNWVHTTNRFLLIAIRKGDALSFQKRLDMAWERYFSTEDGFQAFLQKLNDQDVNGAQFDVAFAAREAFILAYQKFNTDGNTEQSSLWQKRATLLSEALVKCNPLYGLHYQRVIKPKLSLK